jgi:hypothetical protein
VGYCTLSIIENTRKNIRNRYFPCNSEFEVGRELEQGKMGLLGPESVSSDADIITRSEQVGGLRVSGSDSTRVPTLYDRPAGTHGPCATVVVIGIT